MNNINDVPLHRSYSITNGSINVNELSCDDMDRITIENTDKKSPGPTLWTRQLDVF